MKAPPSSRAPRGTKLLAQAFFAAADEIPEGQRDAVVKAALSAIRDTLKVNREKARATKAKAKGKAPAARGRKSSATAPRKAAKGRKAPVMRGRRPAQEPTPETDAQTNMA